MSKRKKQKAARRATAAPTATPPPVATPPPTKATAPRVASRKEPRVLPLVFGRETYKWLGIGFALIVLGFALMIGGRGDDPTVFDEDVIYSFRKITLAPILILAGLGVTTFAIFKK